MISWHRCNGCFLIIGLMVSLPQTALTSGAQTVVEKGMPINNGRFLNLWAPKPERSISIDQIWFMTTTPGTSSITMKAKLANGNKSPLVGIDGVTTFHEIDQPNKWHKLQVKKTNNYGASTVLIEDEYFYPKGGRNERHSPQIIYINSTSDIYWAKLDPNKDPFLKLRSGTCSSSDSDTKTLMLSVGGDGGFKIDLWLMVSLGANALLVLLLMIIVCYYKQKIRAEITLRKSRDHQKVTYRQSLDPSACISAQPSYPQTLDPAAYISSEDQTHTEKYDTYHSTSYDEGFQWGSLNHENRHHNAGTHHLQGRENSDYQEN